MHRIIYNELIKSVKDKTIFGGFVALTFFVFAGVILLRFATFLPNPSFEEYMKYGYSWIITVVMPFVVISSIYRIITEERVKGRQLIYEALPYLKIEIFGAKVLAIVVKLLIYLLFFNLVSTLLGTLVLGYGLQLGSMFGLFFRQIPGLLPILGFSFIALIPATLVGKSGHTSTIMALLAGAMVGIYMLKLPMSKGMILTPLIERILKPLEVFDGYGYIGISIVYILLSFGIAYYFYTIKKPKSVK